MKVRRLSSRPHSEWPRCIAMLRATIAKPTTVMARIGGPITAWTPSAEHCGNLDMSSSIREHQIRADGACIWPSGTLDRSHSTRRAAICGPAGQRLFTARWVRRVSRHVFDAVNRKLGLNHIGLAIEQTPLAEAQREAISRARSKS